MLTWFKPSIRWITGLYGQCNFYIKILRCEAQRVHSCGNRLGSDRETPCMQFLTLYTKRRTVEVKKKNANLACCSSLRLCSTWSWSDKTGQFPQVYNELESSRMNAKLYFGVIRDTRTPELYQQFGSICGSSQFNLHVVWNQQWRHGSYEYRSAFRNNGRHEASNWCYAQER